MANLSCPYKDSPEWKALVAKVGAFEAYRDYIENNGEIRSPEVVFAKVQLKKTLTEGGIISSKKLSPNEVKPGVSELFESNSELANAVYKTLGFEGDTVEADIENTVTDALKQKVFRIGKVPFEKTEFENLNIYVKKKNDNEFSIAVDNKGKSIFGLVSAVLDFQRRDLDSNSIYAPNPKGFILWETFLNSEVAGTPKAKVIVDNRFSIMLGTLKALKNNGIEFINFPEKFFKDFKNEYGQFLKQEYSSIGFTDSTDNKLRTVEIAIDDLIRVASLKNTKSQITSQQKQQAQRLYSQYLESIFPDSQVKDILYHGTYEDFEKFVKEKLGTTTGLGSFVDEKTGEEISVDSANTFFLTDDKNNAISYSYKGRSNLLDKVKIALDSITTSFGGMTAQEAVNFIKTIPYYNNLIETAKQQGKSKDQIVDLLKLEREKVIKNTKVKFSSLTNWLVNVEDARKEFKSFKDQVLKFKANDLSIKNKYGTFNESGTQTNDYNIFNEDGRYVFVGPGERFYADKVDTKTITKFLDDALKAIDKSDEERKAELKRQGYIEKALAIVVDLKNPLVHDYEKSAFPDKYKNTNYDTQYVAARQVKKALEENRDGVVYQNIKDPLLSTTYGVFDPEQIHILGSKQDIQRFKEFVKEQKSEKVQDRKPVPVKAKEITLIQRFKKAVGLSGKIVNPSRQAEINAAVERFNKVNNTNYYVEYKQIGQSNSYTYTITGGSKGQMSMFYRYDENNITAPENLLPNSTASYEALDKLPIEYNTQANNHELGLRMVSNISKRLAENIGLSYENVTPEEAAKLTAEADIPWNGEPAFFIGDTVYYVGNNISEATQLHEFAHPLVRAILVSNPELFNRLYDKLASSPEGKEVIAEVTKKYKEEVYAGESNKFKEEVIVRATEKAAVLQRQNQLGSNVFIKAIKDILYQFKKIFRELFGKVKVSNLDVNTSIDELADMLQNEFFDIKQDIVSLKDEVAYQRITDDYRNELSKIIEKDPEGLQAIADKQFKLASDYLYKLEKDANYEALNEILKDQYSSNDLAEIKAGISNYQRVVIKTARQVRDDMDFRRNQVAAIVQNVQRTFQIATKLNSYMEEVAKQKATPELVNKMHYYSTMLNDINEFANLVATVLDQNNLGNTKLADHVNAIKGRVEASERHSAKVYAEGVTDTLYSFIDDVVKGIKERKKERIDYLTEKGAKPEFIAAEARRFDDLIVDKDKFIATLNGNLGDQGALSAFFESYAGNPDPVIASFGLYIKKHIYDVLYKTKDRIYDLHNKLVPVLEKAGYKGTNPEAFFKDFVYLEKTFAVENGEEKLNQFDYAFLAPTKGSDYWYAKQSFTKKQLKQKAIETGDYIEYAKFLKEESEYKRKYFNQSHSDEYYDLDKIYDKDYTYTDENGEKQTINGWEAYSLLETINQDLRLIDEDPLEDLDIQQKTRDKDVVLRRRARLFDLKYENGQPKVGKDLAIAQILTEYRNAVKPYIEYSPRPDAFQQYLMRYEELLRSRGVSEDQFTDLRQKFIIANTQIAYEDKYFEDLALASKELNDLLDTIPSNKVNRDAMKNAIDEISSALLGYRDEDGQPMANDMPEDRIKRVKDAELLIEQLRNISGLTPEEWDKYNSYWDLINTKKGLNAQQQARFDQLSEQKEGGLTSIQKKQLAKAYDKFNAIREKEATDYYIDRFNYFLSKVDTDVLNDDLGIREIDKVYANAILSGKDFPTAKLYALLNQDEEFKTWFEENHHRKSYSGKGGEELVFFKRLGIWSVNRPTNDSYYKKTQIKDAEGKVVETINRVPSFKFRERIIKDKVEIKDDYGRVVKTINNVTPRIVGKTIDNRERWLPRSVEQGAPKDSPFINNDYYALKNNNPTKFEALEQLKEFHLASQEGLDNQSKSYLYIPRYGKDLAEKIQTKGTLKEKRNKLTEFVNTVKEVFVARPDDYEKGLSNYKPQNQYMSIAGDMFDDDASDIAITGLSRMDYNTVSLDLPKSVMKFGLAAERQKKLVEIWPIAHALSELLSDPKASLTIEKMVKSQYVNRQLAIKPSKKSDSQRAQSVNNLIDREFKGINLKGFGADQTWLVKGVSNMMRMASFGFFGLDFQSANINTSGMFVQSIIDAAGGNNLNQTTLADGTFWAHKTVMPQLSLSIYKQGQNKPLELQMWEMFDPAQGRLEAKMPDELSRSLGRDMMNLSFVYSPRKFGELANMASMFGGMMKYKKIKQTIGNVTKEISYRDAWTLKDGKLTLREGIDKEYDIGGNKFRLFQNMMHEKMRKLGSVANYDSPEANRHLIVRMVTFLRKFLIPMITHRMGFSGKPWNPKESVNYASGEAQMGTYIRTIKELFRAFKYGGQNIKYMSKEDAAAFYRALTEIGLLIGMNMALYWMFGYDPNDEKRYEKLRKKSGPLPSPFVDEKVMKRYPFNLEGWLANHAAYQLIKIRAENESFLPLPGFGLDDYSRLISFDAGTLFSPTIGNGTKVLTGLYDYSMGNPSAYYKKDIGSYEFQQAHGLKALNYLAKMLGLSGKTVDPVTAIKNFTSIQAATGGTASGRKRKDDNNTTGSDSYLIR